MAPEREARTARVDVSHVAPAGVHECVVDVFVPDGVVDTVACCLPGGGFSRRYFDLEAAGDDGSYSMARHLVARGIAVVLCDPPGIGESDLPDDSYSLTPHALADVQAAVVDAVSGQFPRARRIGVGHSAGALLTVHQQARHRQFDALVLLGFAGRGLVAHLTKDELAYANDPDGLRAALAALVKERFGDGLPVWESGPSSIFSGGSAPSAAKAAMRAAQARMLGMLGLTSMIPGASAPELAAIDVPLFVGVGSNDITGPPHRIPGDFPNAHDVTLFVLEGAGHTHHIDARRSELWERVVAWLTSLPTPQW
jgi:pimeloyl-ACP methyl ester carboxylesterase